MRHENAPKPFKFVTGPDSLDIVHHDDLPYGKSKPKEAAKEFKGGKLVISHTPTTYPEYLKGEALVAYLKTLPPKVVEQLTNLDPYILAQVITPTVSETKEPELSTDADLQALYVAAILGSTEAEQVETSSEPQK
jgi:hypothetical protein